MATFKNKADAEKKLQLARNKLVKLRKKWKADPTPQNKAAMDKALAECVAIEDIINKHY